MSVLVRLGATGEWKFAAVMGFWLLSLSAFSQSQAAARPSAHDVVRKATTQVMAVVEEARGYAQDDPDRYFQAVDEILEPVIDYRGFARSVMGPYASGDRYRSLDEAARAQLRGQLERFTEVMRTGLVATYSKGLLAFSGSRIEVSEPLDADSKQSRVSVHQLIYSEESQPYVLMYQMGLDKQKQWKLRNIIIESVNLGEIYKNQFQASARKYDGDLDVVIDNWSGSKSDS
ncbi:MAG: ABC transporter substrate-binding protein [Proteobacteria bacterium]|nr:ABC transporter substrate-binding protein [Pseudomonadota bacterium]